MPIWSLPTMFGMCFTSTDFALSDVRIEIVDSDGRLVPDAAAAVRLSIDGPAKIVGFGSGSPRATGSFQSRQTQTFAGRALAILRSTGTPGIVRIEVSGEGIGGGSAVVRFTA